MIKNNQVFDKYIDSKGLEYSKGKKIVIGTIRLECSEVRLRFI
jgi:hypothetical protein